jgi:hypothetical protein
MSTKPTIMVLPGRFEGLKVWTIWKDSRGLLHVGQRKEETSETAGWGVTCPSISHTPSTLMTVGGVKAGMVRGDDGVGGFGARTDGEMRGRV